MKKPNVVDHIGAIKCAAKEDKNGDKMNMKNYRKFMNFVTPAQAGELLT